MDFLRKIGFAHLVLFLSLSQVNAQLSGNDLDFQEQYESGKLYVTASPNGVLLYNASQKLYSNIGALDSLIHKFDIIGFAQLVPDLPQHEDMYYIQCNCDEDDLLEAVYALPRYYTIPEKVRIPQLLYTPNDYNTAFNEDWALDLINAEEAWGIQTGDSNVVLAICDNGFDLNQEELVGTYVQAQNTNAPQSHGTAVAIIAAGNTDNNVGKSSIGFDCSLALWNVSLGQVALASSYGARVVNMSWSTGCTYSSYEQAQVNLALSYGAMLVASAGNGNLIPCNGSSTPVYPAAYTGVVAVSSVDFNDNHEAIPGDSSSTHSHYAEVDLVAPGYNVPMAGMGNVYGNSSGTSFAAPFVTGTAGLLFSENPAFTNDEVEQILKCSADDIYSQNPSYIGLLGAGRLNAGEALKMARNFTSPSIETGCNGTGSASITTLGNGNYSFLWSTGNTVQSISGLAQGTYSVEITHQCGFSKSFDFVIDSIPVVSAGSDQVVCDGTSVTLTASGSGVIAYAWDNGVVDNTIFTSPVGTVTYTVIGNAINGCTNTDQVNVTVNPLPSVDVDVDLDLNLSPTLTVSESNAQYQWLNCNKSYSILVGETNQTLIANSNGNYAVHVTTDGCVDTSACILITTIGISETEIDGLTVMPNPTDGIVNIAFGDIYNRVSVTVLDATGRVLHEESIENSFELNLLLDQPPGLYTLKIITDSKQTNARIIKQ